MSRHPPNGEQVQCRVCKKLIDVENLECSEQIGGQLDLVLSCQHCNAIYNAFISFDLFIQVDDI